MAARAVATIVITQPNLSVAFISCLDPIRLFSVPSFAGASRRNLARKLRIPARLLVSVWFSFSPVPVSQTRLAGFSPEGTGDCQPRNWQLATGNWEQGDGALRV